MICEKCGVQLQDHVRFCHECGALTNATVKEGPIDPASLTKLKLSQFTMGSRADFILEEKDGVTLFSCEYQIPGCEPVKHEGTPVNPTNMREVRAFARENDYLNLDPNTPMDPRLAQFTDAGGGLLRLEWGSRKTLDLSAHIPPKLGELMRIFRVIAENIPKQEL